MLTPWFRPQEFKKHILGLQRWRNLKEEGVALAKTLKCVSSFPQDSCQAHSSNSVWPGKAKRLQAQQISESLLRPSRYARFQNIFLEWWPVQRARTHTITRRQRSLQVLHGRALLSWFLGSVFHHNGSLFLAGPGLDSAPDFGSSTQIPNLQNLCKLWCFVH